MRLVIIARIEALKEAEISRIPVSTLQMDNLLPYYL